jgi:sortase family protein
MRPFHLSTIGNHRVLAATVVTGVLTVGGVTGVAVALLGQHHAPEPPLVTASIPATSATVPPKPSLRTVGPILTASVPVSIAIPVIGVNSVLLQLGRTSTGALEVPPTGPHYDEAGWYRYSPAPGSLGPAVIAGHVDSAAHGPSVFYRLGGLRPNDRIRITRSDGSIAIFVVNDIHRYHKTAFPTSLVYGNTDHAALRLITCGGAFDSSTGHYLDDIVVRASLQSAENRGAPHR